MAPDLGESLLLYVATATQVVSTALVVEQPEEGRALKVQRPMYFVSEVLSESKVRYPRYRIYSMRTLSLRESVGVP